MATDNRYAYNSDEYQEIINTSDDLIKQPFIWVNSKASAFAYYDIEQDGNYVHSYTGYLKTNYSGGEGNADYRNSVIFIKDTNEIWARGQFFGLSAESVATINANFNALQTGQGTINNAISEIQGTYVTTIEQTAVTHTNSPFISGFELSKTGKTYKIKPTYSGITATGDKNDTKYVVSDITVTEGYKVNVSYAQVHTGTSTTASLVTNNASYAYINNVTINNSGELSIATTGTYLSSDKIAYGTVSVNSTGAITGTTKTVYNRIGELQGSINSLKDQHLASTKLVWSSNNNLNSNNTARPSTVTEERSSSNTYIYVEFVVWNETESSYTYMYLPAEKLLTEISGTQSESLDTVKIDVSPNTGSNGETIISGSINNISAYKITTAQVNANSYYTYSTTQASNGVHGTAYVKWPNNTTIQNVSYALSEAITKAYLGNYEDIRSLRTTVNNTETTYVKAKNLKFTAAYDGTNNADVFINQKAYTKIPNNTTYTEAIKLLDRALGVAYTQLNTYVTGVVKKVDGKTPNANGEINLSIPTAINVDNSLPNDTTSYINIAQNISYYSAIETLDKAIKYAYDGARQYASSVATEAAALKWVVI